MSDFCDRYIAYCNAHGRTPEQQLEADALRWPGGKMTGYMLWIPHQWKAFRRDKCLQNHFESTWMHEAFDRWLAEAAAVTPNQITENTPC